MESRYRIRKLTPKECWRLMGFSDTDFYKAKKVNSNTQLYKEAGNSIVKNCLMDIFGQMNLMDDKSEKEAESPSKPDFTRGGVRDKACGIY